MKQGGGSIMLWGYFVQMKRSFAAALGQILTIST